MKATGEVMSIGRTMEESLLKAVRSLEIGVCHIYTQEVRQRWPNDELLDYIKEGTDDRLYAIAPADPLAASTWALIYDATKIDMLFLEKIKNIVDFENVAQTHTRWTSRRSALPSAWASPTSTSASCGA